MAAVTFSRLCGSAKTAIAAIAISLFAPQDAVAANEPQQVVEIEVAFDYAMAALNEGRPDIAIPILQAILAEDAKLIRVRLELARAYFMAEQWARSREEFFRALSGDLPEPVRQKVLGFIRQIDARRGFDWDLSLGFTTAGNNRSYRSENIRVNPAYAFGATSLSYSQPVERVPAVTLNGTMTLRRQLDGLSSAQTSVVGFASLGLEALEAEGREYDDQRLRFRMGLRLLSPTTTVSFGPVVRSQWYQGRHYEDRYGVEAAFERRSLMGGSAYGSLAFSNIDNRSNNAYDGSSLTGTVGFRRSVGGRAVVGTELNYEKRDADGFMQAFGGYQSYTLSTYATVSMNSGWTLRPRLFVRRKTAQTVNPLFVDNPNETGIGGSLRVERSDIFIAGGYTPYVQFDFERNRSGIEAFSYDSFGVQFGVERRF